MKLEFYKSSSSVKPEMIDTTSSKKVVYIRQNIIEAQKDDAVFYDYEEAKLTKAEYQEYLKELEIIDIQQQRADIDYIMLMMGIKED